MKQTPLPKEETAIFKQLGELKVIFDVGARTDTEYLEIRPNSEFHLFEPNPIFYDELVENIINRGNVQASRIGLGNKSGFIKYNDMLQAFEGGAQKLRGFMSLPIYTLDWYVQEFKIEQIDFLKIDTEGYDLNVLKGGKNTLPKAKFIQYEHWGEENDKKIRRFLGKLFEIEYIGYRNCLCMNKELVNPQERARIVAFIRENEYNKLQ